MTVRAKISISLPRELLESADRARRAAGESRSEFVRRAIEALLRSRRERQAVRRYVAGYVAEPESDAEAELAEAWASEGLEEESWE